MGKIKKNKIAETDTAAGSLQEPIVAYGTTNAAGAGMLPSAWQLLYNTSTPASSFDYLENAIGGVPKASAMKLANTMDVPLKDMASLLNISYKTFARKKPADKMDTLTSSLTIEIANVIAEGVTTFGSLQKFRNWLQKPNRALASHTPFSLLNTPTGIKMVQNVLGRINEGIYT